MKFLRFKNKADSLNNDLKTKSGFIDDEGKVIELKGDILDYFNKDIKFILYNITPFELMSKWNYVIKGGFPH